MSDNHSQVPNTDPALPPSSDPLGQALQLLRLSGTLYCDAWLSDPWGIEIPPLSGVMNVDLVTEGSCWIELEGQQPQKLTRGSLVLLPHGRRHVLRGRPGDAVTRLEHIPVRKSGERHEHMVFGGNGRTTRISYFGVRYDARLADRLVRVLPPLLHLETGNAAQHWLQGTVRLIEQEAREQHAGHDIIITRLADILVIQAIRGWLETLRGEERGWIAALHDRKVGKALSLMHRQPAHDWRIDTLARMIGMSRSAFAARFTEMVGESVMQYLTTLRMQLAYHDLRETNDTLASIAERAGYASEPTFHRAFKREIGLSPGAARRLR